MNDVKVNNYMTLSADSSDVIVKIKEIIEKKWDNDEFDNERENLINLVSNFYVN